MKHIVFVATMMHHATCQWGSIDDHESAQYFGLNENEN